MIFTLLFLMHQCAKEDLEFVNGFYLVILCNNYLLVISGSKLAVGSGWWRTRYDHVGLGLGLFLSQRRPWIMLGLNQALSNSVYIRLSSDLEAGLCQIRLIYTWTRALRCHVHLLDERH